METNNDRQLPLTVTKTRIAPTPSGYLHLGNAFSFALTAALADRYHARIVLRIDDLDRQRVRPAYVQDIFDTLDFLGIEWHEGPRNVREFEHEYSQLHRLDLYHHALEMLTESNTVFACDCSRATVQQNYGSGAYAGHCRGKSLPLNTPEVKWRVHTDVDCPLKVKTLDGTITASLPPEQQHFVVRRKDGLPAYQLASLMDDQYFGIDLVVRGQDLWPSTLAQQYLAMILNIISFTDTTFCHHALLTETNGAKLSKSAGATSIQYLRKSGKSRADVYNLMAQQIGIRENIKDWKELFRACTAGGNHP